MEVKTWNLFEIRKEFKMVINVSFSNRIATLFVNHSEQKRGKVNVPDYKVGIRNSPHDGDEELIDLAVVQTLSHNGAIYNLSPEEMPENKPVLAIFRYTTS